MTGLLLLAAATDSARAQESPLACPPAGSPGAAANALSDAADSAVTPLQAESFVDTTGTIVPAEIPALDFASAGCDGVFAAPAPGEALWLRFQVSGALAGGPTPAVSFVETIFDEVALFEQSGDGLKLRLRNGRTVPAAERAGGSMKTVFPLEVAAGGEQTFYLRITGTFAPKVTAVVGPESLFQTWAGLTQSMSALFLGFVTAIALVCVLLFRRIKAHFYGFYALYMACQFAFTFLYDGWFSQIFGSTLSSFVLVRAAEFSAGLAVFANIQYCRILLEVDADSRLRRWTLMALSLAAALTGILAVIDPWALSLPLHLAYFGCPLVLLVVCALKIREGVPQAKPVFGSLLSLALGLGVAHYFFAVPVPITGAASAFELVALSPLDWTFYLAILGEVTFMALAIATMVQSIQAQRQGAIEEVQALRDHARATAAEHAKALRARGERIEALEARLLDNPVRHLQAPIEQRFVQSATECVIEHLGEAGFGSRELAAALATSEKTLGRRLKESCGLSPAAFIRSIRLNFARDLILMRQHGTVAEIAYAAGFSSVGHFAKLYREQFGQTPSESFKTVKAG